MRPACLLALCLVLALGALAALPDAARAQRRLRPADTRFWVAGAALVATAAALDEPLDRAQRRHRSRLLDRLGDTGNVLGSGRYLIAGMAGSWVAAKATRRQRWADATLRAAAGYALGNAIGSALKPAVGRHRPDSTGDAWRFRPSTHGEWHSFPSAHALHAFTLADALAQETGSRWIAGSAYGAAGLVAWSRIYRSQHWASDVAASAVLGIAASRTAGGWLRARGSRPSADASWRLVLGTRDGGPVVTLQR